MRCKCEVTSWYVLICSHIPEKVNGIWEHGFGNIKLSYSEHDSAFKSRLVSFLNKHGIEPVALQKTTDAKSLGENMIQEKEAIDQCYALIVVISKNYVRSEAISIGESEYAILHSKMVVPIMVPNTNAKLTYDDASTNRAWENWKQVSSRRHANAVCMMKQGYLNTGLGVDECMG